MLVFAITVMTIDVARTEKEVRAGDVPEDIQTGI